jgi:hypothetical protein
MDGTAYLLDVLIALVQVVRESVECRDFAG